MFNNNVFEKNLELIKKKNFRLASEICAAIKKNESRINFENAKNGQLTYCENSNDTQIYIHSKYDPDKEAARIAEQFNLKDTDFAVFIKPGLGYHIKKIISVADIYFLIIEPDLNVLIAALQIIELPVSIDKWNITVSESESEIQNCFAGLFNPLFINKIYYITLQGALSAYRISINAIKNHLMKCVDNVMAQAVTLSYFGEIFHSNAINNFNQFAAAPGINVIKNKFSNLPGVIVAAGPSLDYNISELYKHRKKFIIIAVDTVYGKLLDYGIIPHFTMTIDPQNKSYYHFKNSELRNFFVACPICSNRVVNHLKNKCLFFVSDYPASIYFESVTSHKGQLSTSGGSVSTVALLFAEYIGLNPVILIGQDLSYPVMKTHCSETMYEKPKLTQLTKFNTSENIFFKTTETQIELKGIKSKSVITTKQLLEYFRWYCDFAKTAKFRIINSTYDGAYIDGIEHCSLNEAVEKLKINGGDFDLSMINAFIKTYSDKQYPKVFPEMKSRLLLLKKSVQSHRFHINNLNELRILLEQNSGLFELIKTIAYSKALVELRKKIDSPENEKANCIINTIIESIDFTVGLIDSQSASPKNS